ncbi:MAG: Gfo/Idh/MocA family oxidoreductase [Chloroflexi bacterium]|nr:Gfo/Idh/MocA family oxidoreductase [Chloroflexota bacterium]
MDGIGAAVIGSGFIGTVHVEALRRLGVTVHGILGASADRADAAARRLGVPKAYPDLDALLADPAVDVVHVTSPNRLHFPQVRAIIAAGRHVVCEKPLAVTSEESAELVALAAHTDRICAVNYNIRFYPLNQHLHGEVAAGTLGDIRLLSGRYFQDWLFEDTDWNWRLDPAEGGTLRAFGDIGTHWVDLVSFITGSRVAAVMAELVTAIPTRQQPAGPVETFSTERSTDTIARQMSTDDIALLLLRFENGARGSVAISQVSAGRKNSLQYEIDGSRGSAAWDSETPDHLWLGHRDRPNEILQRGPALMNALGSAAASLPGGHVEGFGDTFHALFRAIYQAVAAGRMPDRPTFATFEDGHHEMLLGDAVLVSAREGRWVDVASVSAPIVEGALA